MTMIEDFVSTFVGGAATVVAKVVGAGARLFGDDPKQSPADRTNNVLFGAGGPPTAPRPPAPPPGGPGGAGGPEPGAGGLRVGAEHAGQSYADDVNAAALTDEKLSALLEQIFTTNQNARDKVNAILADIEDKSKQVGPELGDPASLLSFHQYLDQKFGEIQKLLADSQVDATTQAAIMGALGDEYRTNSPKNSGDGSGGAAGSGGGDGSSSGGGGGSGGSAGDDGAAVSDGGGDAGASSAGGGTDPLTDPMAGVGPLGGVDPMSMLGPAMAGVGSLPGALGGFGGMGGGSALDALGPALQSLGPALAGAKDSFGDGKSGTQDKNGSEVTGSTGDKPEDVKDSGSKDSKAPVAQDVSAPAARAGQAGPELAPGTPEAAAPAAAPLQAAADPQKTVEMPGGTAVTAPNAERAAAMRSVIGGSSVTGAYEGQDVHLPPPGTPVLAPVSRNDLQPGDYGQFSTKAAIMYMGNDKIWMDGQLQPIGALQSSSDFLGWSAPPSSGAQQTGAGAPTAPPSGKV